MRAYWREGYEKGWAPEERATVLGWCWNWNWSWNRKRRWSIEGKTLHLGWCATSTEEIFTLLYWVISQRAGGRYACKIHKSRKTNILFYYFEIYARPLLHYHPLPKSTQKTTDKTNILKFFHFSKMIRELSIVSHFVSVDAFHLHRALSRSPTAVCNQVLVKPPSLQTWHIPNELTDFKLRL